MLRRPPAKAVSWPRQQGPSGRVHFGAVDSAKAYGGGQHGNVVSHQAPGGLFQYTWQDLLQINPAHEQPRLVWYSGAQPFIRTGHLRRIVRTFMSASPRFQGRWAFVGFQQRMYAERARMTGVATRQGTTYNYPRFKVSPRAVQLG